MIDFIEYNKGTPKVQPLLYARILPTTGRFMVAVVTATGSLCLNKRSLHVHNVQPAAMFKTEICSDAYVIETRRSVQPD